MESWFWFPALALVAGVLALGPLGAEVLRRGVVFIDLAVAQAAAATVIWLGAWMHHQDRLATQLAGTLGALGMSLAVAWLARRWASQREALIGLLYVASAMLALLGASRTPHGKDRLIELLAADVLWVDPIAAGMLLVCAAAVLLLQVWRGSGLTRDAVFYAGFAVVASVAVPALGLFLVFACLIAPALWIERGAGRALALGGGVAVSVTGLLVSWWWDAPSGPCVALLMTGYGLAAITFDMRPRG